MLQPDRCRRELVHAARSSLRKAVPSRNRAIGSVSQVILGLRQQGLVANWRWALDTKAAGLRHPLPRVGFGKVSVARLAQGDDLGVKWKIDRFRRSVRDSDFGDVSIGNGLHDLRRGLHLQPGPLLDQRVCRTSVRSLAGSETGRMTEALRIATKRDHGGSKWSCFALTVGKERTLPRSCNPAKVDASGRETRWNEEHAPKYILSDMNTLQISAPLSNESLQIRTRKTERLSPLPANNQKSFISRNLSLEFFPFSKKRLRCHDLTVYRRFQMWSNS